jgi:hypothetical protein
VKDPELRRVGRRRFDGARVERVAASPLDLVEESHEERVAHAPPVLDLTARRRRVERELPVKHSKNRLNV